MIDNIKKIPGEVQLIDYMGTSQAVINAARISIGGQKRINSDIALLKYLWTRGHTSPFEHITASFKIKAPLFTARQIMRHRTFSYSEVSGRYSELTDGYYLPKTLMEQDSTEKHEDGITNSYEMGSAMLNLDYLYRKLLRKGVSREQARMILPVSTFTSFTMTGNLLNWIKFLKLRLAEGAQYETWFIAEWIYEIFSEGFSEIFDFLEEELIRTPQE